MVVIYVIYNPYFDSRRRPKNGRIVNVVPAVFLALKTYVYGHEKYLGIIVMIYMIYTKEHVDKVLQVFDNVLGFRWSVNKNGEPYFSPIKSNRRLE
jgi:hypothetical protein